MAAYDIDLTIVSYAEGIDTIFGNGVTSGYCIHFPRGINLDRTNPNEDDVRWMLHELEHVVQYKGEGGVNKFLLKYIVQSITTAPWQKSIRDIHHNMGLERDTKAKAKSLLEGVLRELGDLALGRETVLGSNLGSFINLTNQVIREGDYLQSANGLYRFICQGDGNVVLYRPGMSVIWASYTDGMGHPPYRIVAQADGNVVQYDSTQTALWRTGTDKSGHTDCFFILQDDRNLVLYERGQPAKALWHTKTYIKS